MKATSRKSNQFVSRANVSNVAYVLVIVIIVLLKPEGAMMV